MYVVMKMCFNYYEHKNCNNKHDNSSEKYNTDIFNNKTLKLT